MLRPPFFAVDAKMCPRPQTPTPGTQGLGGFRDFSDSSRYYSEAYPRGGYCEGRDASPPYQGEPGDCDHQKPRDGEKAEKIILAYLLSRAPGEER